MTIAKAIDYINDKLAGSDQPASDNIETALYRLAEHVGGGTLEPATADTLGGVKIGEGISVTSDGTISAAGASGLCTDTEGTLDKSYNDLLAMWSAGVVPFVIWQDGSNNYLCQCVFLLVEDESYISSFSFYNHESEQWEATTYVSSDPDAPMVMD